MLAEIFVLGITICSAFTALLTEAVKKILDAAERPYNSNILAAICSIIVAIITVIAYVVMQEVPITNQLIVLSILLVIFSWLGAMVGYDKVIQTIHQLIHKEDK